MKKIIPFIVLLVVISVAVSVSQTSTDRPDSKNDSGSLTFEAKLYKKEYLPFEPISVEFKASNNTGSEISAPPPDILHQAELFVIDPAGREQRITSLSLSTGGHLFNLPGPRPVIQPSEVFQAETILPLDPGIFEKTGNYRLQFVLNGVRSEAINIAVKGPSGIDKNAYEFLKQHGKDPNFVEVLMDKKGAGVVEKFVREFSESVYGDYAINALGRYLLYNGEAEKAKAEFEKISNSEIKLLRDWSKNDLTEVEKKLQRKPLD
jgi:hypothetical protein